MKNIWIINQYASPISESVRQIKLSKFLKQHNYNVTIICGSKVHNTTKNLITNNSAYKKIEFDDQSFFVVKSMNYVGNGIKRIIASIKFQFDFVRLSKKLPKPDVIISDFTGLFGNMFLKFKKRYKAKFILDILDLWPETFVDMGYLPKNNIITKVLYSMERKGYRKADNIIFSFEGGKDYIIEKKWDLANGGDIDIDKVRYLNNGVDLQEVLERRQKFVLNDADLDSEKFTAVYLGSISEANNIQAIVGGAEILNNMKINDIQILVYGDGSQRNQLEKECAEKNLPNIKFKGRLPIEYAPNVLNRSNLNLFNFADVPLLRFGCSPNKLFMYLAAEKPILSTVNPKYELVETNNCGKIVKNTGDEIAKGIIFMKELDKKRYQIFCENSKEMATKFDYKYLVEEVLMKLVEENL